MKTIRLLLTALGCLGLLTTALHAQVPQLINYQGRVAVGTTNFNGSGTFKFALVNAAGNVTYWSNNGTSVAGSQPTAAVTLTVTKGLYSVLLGDATLANMTAIPASVFANADVRLRVWFNDGTNGSQLLTPDQRLAAVGYAMIAGGVNLPATTSATEGVIMQGGAPLMHSFGSYNFFAGPNAGNFSMTGGFNLGLGSGALASNTQGDTNVAGGLSALGSNTTGSGNTAAGAQALHYNLTGNNNTATGINALFFNTTGERNTALGASALESATGSDNIALGTFAGINLTSGNNNIAIGHPGVAGEAGIIRIGTPGTQTDTYLTGIIHGNGAGLTIAPGAITSVQIAPGTVIPSQTIAGTTQTAVANGRYLATSASLTNISLPTTANVGDVVEITGAGAGGWNMYSQAIWTPRESSRPWFSVASSADGTRLAAVVFGGQIYTSANSGATWTARESNRSWTSVASSADGTHLAAVAYLGKIYTSADSGVNWTAQNGAPFGEAWWSVASSSDGTRLAAVATGGQIYTSANSGVTWTARESNRNWDIVASSSDGTHLAAGVSGGQIYTSANSGVTWTAQGGAPSADWRSLACSSDGTRLAAAVYGGQIYTSADSGVTWAAQSGAPSVYWSSVASSSDGTHLAAVDSIGQIYTSGTSGVIWTAQSGAPSGAGWKSVASSADGTRLAAVVANGQIYTSANVLSFAGAQGTTAALQYLGNGQWGAVGQTQIAANAVGSTQIVANAVGSTQIAAGAVGSSQIAAGAVGSIQIGNLSIATGHLADSSVTAAKLGSDVGLWSVNAADVFRSGGNVGIGTATPATTLTVRNGGGYGIEHTDGTHRLGTYLDPSGGWLGTVSNDPLHFFTNDGAQQMTLATNGNVGIGKTDPATKLDVDGEITVTAVNITSDRNAKEQFQPVNARAVLDKVARLPISEWQYKEQSDARHIGPMAQDFHAAFAVGRDEKHITTVDADGVALAAIQGLNEKLEERERDKDTRIRELENSVRELKELVNQLAGQQNGGAK